MTVSRLILMIAVAVSLPSFAEVVGAPEGLSPRARKVLREFGVENLRELTERFTVADLRKNWRIDFEVRREILGAVKKAGLVMRAESAALQVQTKTGTMVLSEEARAILKKMGVTSAEDLARRYTIRNLLWSVPRRDSEPQREIIAFAVAEGHRLRLGVGPAALSAEDALAKLREMKFLYDVVGTSRVEDIPKRLSFLELADLIGSGYNRAFQIAELLAAAGLPMSITEFDRRHHVVDELDCGPSLDQKS